MRDFFTLQAPDIAKQVVALYPDLAKFKTSIAKADDELTDEQKLQAQVDQALLELNFDGWSVLYDDAAPVLEQIAKYSAARALVQVEVVDKDITKLTDENAVAWAKFRSAQLVGKRIEDGKLIDNPDAEWSITESTRTYLRSTVTDAVNEGWSTDTLAKEIKESTAFDDNRADMVARTETAFADTQGALIGYKDSGVVEGKVSLLSDDYDDDDECQDNADAGVVPIYEAFPSGDDGPPYHPRCKCSLSPVVIDEGEES